MREQSLCCGTQAVEASLQPLRGLLKLVQLNAAGVQSAEEFLDDLPGVGLIEQKRQALYRDGADFLDGLAFGFGADDVNKALILALLRS